MRTNVSRVPQVPPQLCKTRIIPSLSIEGARKTKAATVMLTHGTPPSAWEASVRLAAMKMKIVAPSANAIRAVVEFKPKVYAEVEACFSTTPLNVAFSAV